VTQPDGKVIFRTSFDKTRGDVHVQVAPASCCSPSPRHRHTGCLLTQAARVQNAFVTWRAVSARPFMQGVGVGHYSICFTNVGGALQIRGLHSSTYQLNVSASCGIGGACRGCLGGVSRCKGALRGVQGVYLFSNGSG